jgi:broad specificity phosphatase PhoE
MLLEWPAKGHLHLVRHAEARKNVEDRQGGQGTELTHRGVDQARRISEYLNAYEVAFGHKLTVYGHSVPQVQQTAALISSSKGWPSELDEDLRGIHLGLLDGLTTDEARRVDPVAFERLAAWRRGKLPVNEVSLPGAEDFQRFRYRVSNALRRILSSCAGTCAAIVGTQSTLIMLINILNLGIEFEEKSYSPYSFPNGFISRWKISSGLGSEDERHIVPVTLDRPFIG